MTEKLLLTLIAVIAITIPVAYAQVDEVDVGFEWGWKNCTESTVATAEGSVPRLNCSWLGELPEGATITFDREGTIDVIIEEETGTETEISDEATITPKPVIKTELQIKVQGIKTAQEQLESYWKGEVSVEILCFGGTERESQIFEQHETIDVKRPNDNIPLQSNPQYKYELILSEICKAEYALKYKVHNWLKTPQGEGDSYIFSPRTSFDDLYPEATTEYAKRDKLDYYFQATQQFAKEFQCSSEGKSRGLCVYDKMDQVEPEPTISQEGKQALADYWALRETGEAEIPKQEPEGEFDPTVSLDQYIKAYNISEEDLKEWYESRNP